MSAAVAAILQRAADLIAPEGAWIQGSFGRPGECYCVRGAIGAASGSVFLADGHAASEIAFAASIGRPHGTDNAAGCSLVTWNDSPDRTQAEVVQALRDAAALARAEAGQ